ncbi:ATP-binding protein [Sphaerimonospora sp. CA-214678]|uniref:ATP-binding protein n=1 Tax=Sphaerimonospora sp. CA-214678 TaxID=3240029 RepID=UPI003D922E6D
MLTSPFPVEDDGGGAAHKVLGAGWTAPGRARAFVHGQVGRWGLPHLADTAELLVSELVTNAVRAMRSGPSPLMIVSSMFLVTLRSVAVRLRLPSASRSLFIEVWDASASVPVPRSGAGPDDGELEEGGRGLTLVESLAMRWGCRTAPDRGKIVWCELAISPVAAPDIVPAPVTSPPVAVPVGTPPAPSALPAHALPRRLRRHPRADRAEGPDRDTLLRVLRGLRDLD